VVQFYVSPPAGCDGPKVKLVDFASVELPPGASTRIMGRLPAATWSIYGEDGRPHQTSGDWRMYAALAAPVERARELGVPAPLLAMVSVI
jgi:hypothetical protein